MNDQQILALVATTPDIRAVQIADALDKPLTDVSAALRSLVEVGDILQSKGTAPNNHPTMVYNLSDEFKKSKDYRAVMAIVEAQRPPVSPGAAAMPVVEPVVPAQAKAEPVAIPVFAPKDPPRDSKAQRGVDYIVKHGSVSHVDLQKVMELTKLQFPAAYLTSAIRNKIVHKVGNTWKAGAAPTATVTGPVVKITDAGAKPKDTVAVQQPTRDQQPVAAVVATKTTVVPAVVVAPVFRCGLWSDGVLELQRDGSTVAVLEQGEGEQLASFVNRMLLDPLGTGVQTSTHSGVGQPCA